MEYFLYIDINPCASNPCKNGAGCVKDAETGYRCETCHSHYTGPKCEESKITLQFLTIKTNCGMSTY